MRNTPYDAKNPITSGTYEIKMGQDSKRKLLKRLDRTLNLNYARSICHKLCTIIAAIVSMFLFNVFTTYLHADDPNHLIFAPIQWLGGKIGILAPMPPRYVLMMTLIITVITVWLLFHAIGDIMDIVKETMMLRLLHERINVMKDSRNPEPEMFATLFRKFCGETAPLDFILMCLWQPEGIEILNNGSSFIMEYCTGIPDDVSIGYSIKSHALCCLLQHYDISLIRIDNQEEKDS